MNPQNESQDYDPTSSSNPNEQPQEPNRPQAPYSASPDAEPTTGEQSSVDPYGTPAAPATGLTEAESEPTPSFANTAPAAPVQLAAKRSKKPLILAAVIGGILLLIGGTAAAYQFWYQNPDKVVSDSLSKALSAKTATFTGSLDTSGQAAKLKVDLDGAVTEVAATTHAKTTVTVGAVNLTIDGNVQTSQNGDLYVKLANAKDLAGTVTQMMGGQSSSVLDTFAAKINDKWIKITPKDLDASGGTTGTTMSCVSDTLSKVRSDASMRNELTDLYNKHRFITVKQSLGEKNGSLGYQLDSDRAKLKDFVVGMKTTKFYAAMQKCDSTFKLDENEITKESSSDDVTGGLEIWSNKWTHQLTQVKVTGQSKGDSSSGSLVLNPVFNKPVTVTAPTDAMTVSELQQDIQSLSMSMMPTSTTAY